MLTNHEAIQILKKDVEEEKNWRSARGRLFEVLESAEAAQGVLATLDKTRREHTSTIEALEKRISDLARSEKTARDATEQAIKDKKAAELDRDKTLARIRVEIDETQRELMKVQDAFNTFKLEHKLA
jgi:hypothetical protein